MADWLKKSFQNIAGSIGNSNDLETSKEPLLTPAAALDEINPVKWLLPRDLTWACANNGTSESLSFYIHLKDGGGFMMVQLAHSSLALSPVVIYGLYFTRNSDKLSIAKSQTVSGSDCTLDKTNKTSLELKHGSMIRLETGPDDLAVPVYQVKFAFTDGLELEFTFKGKERPCQIGQLGGFNVRKVGSATYKFCPFGTVAGKLTQPGGQTIPIEGNAMAIKNDQSNKPHLLGNNWEFLSFQQISTQTLICITQITATDGKSVSGLGILVRKGRLIGVTADASCEIHQRHRDEKTKYEISDSVTYSCLGSFYTVDSNGSPSGEPSPFAISIPVKCGMLWRFTDILGELPMLIRKIIQAFLAKPFCFMWWNPAVASIQIKDNIEELDGLCYHESTILKQG